MQILLSGDRWWKTKRRDEPSLHYAINERKYEYLKLLKKKSRAALSVANRSRTSYVWRKK